MSDNHRTRLGNLAREGFDIDFIPMQQRFEGITDRMGCRLRADYFTLTIYFRLLIPTMFPEYDKAIYLDSDVVVNGDISRLFRTALDDNYIAACTDYSVQHVPELVNYIEQGVGVPRMSYINSGILLMNLHLLRERRLAERFFTLLNTWNFDSIAPDQDYINVLCHGHIHYLPNVWDAMPIHDEEPIVEPQVVHYNLFAKPWWYDDVQYADLFWHYAQGSGYYADLCKIKDCYTDAQRAADALCMRRLVERGAMIARAEENFRTVFNIRKEPRL